MLKASGARNQASADCKHKKCLDVPRARVISQRQNGNLTRACNSRMLHARAAVLTRLGHAWCHHIVMSHCSEAGTCLVLCPRSNGGACLVLRIR
eukprot:15413828-Alexandrium_andersonii.AAC.1